MAHPPGVACSPAIVRSSHHALPCWEQQQKEPEDTVWPSVLCLGPLARLVQTCTHARRHSHPGCPVVLETGTVVSWVEQAREFEQELNWGTILFGGVAALGGAEHHGKEEGFHQKSGGEQQRSADARAAQWQ